MRSTSGHSITWTKPDLQEERWEFFQHPAKQPYYRRHSLEWQQLEQAFPEGRLVHYPRADRIGGVPVELCYHRYEDYTRYVAAAKRGYRINYSRMEQALQSQGSLTLPAAIVLVCGGEGLLFSGYRRLCLAWNYGMLPGVWMVELQGDAK